MEKKEIRLTKNIIIPFPNFQENTIISPTQINDNFEEIEHAYNELVDVLNDVLKRLEDVTSEMSFIKSKVLEME